MNEYQTTKHIKGRVGCDNCGEPKPVSYYKGGNPANFQHVYLCNDCTPIIANRRKEMKQTGVLTNNKRSDIIYKISLGDKQK